MLPSFGAMKWITVLGEGGGGARGDPSVCIFLFAGPTCLLYYT